MVKKSGAAPTNPADPASMGRIKQIRMVAGLVRKSNPKAMPLVALAGFGAAAIVIVVGDIIGLLYEFIPLGILFGAMVAMIAFGRFATAAQYAAVEGQPGAAAAILQGLRGGFTTTPAIAANRNMDVVHRTVGKPGVILVGEGSPTRLPSLLAAEKKRIARIASQVPIYDFQVGDGEGQIPIRQLNKKIMKLPRNLRGPAVADLNFRLGMLPQSLQMPKGPVPRSARMPKAPRPRMR
jgi:fluoride ion exporter CrcB/FEX